MLVGHAIVFKAGNGWGELRKRRKEAQLGCVLEQKNNLRVWREVEAYSFSKKCYKEFSI